MIRSLVTGGAGMLANAFDRLLLSKGHQVTVVDDLSRGRLDNIPAEAKFIKHDIRTGMPFDPEDDRCQFDFVFHFAAMIGGVGRMINEPFDSFQNACIDYQVMNWVSQLKKKPRFLQMGTACEYPVGYQTEAAAGHSFLTEDSCFANGANPESLYGWCKVVGEQSARALHQQHGIPVAVVRAFNMYGPGELASVEKAHVIPALIQKAMAGGKVMDVWGTGQQERAFTYTEDAAQAILLAAEKVDDATPINVGTSEMVKIADLAQRVVDLVNPGMTLRFDTTMPTGVFTRAADVSRAKKMLGWAPKTLLTDGLKKTYAWIKERI